MSPVLTPSRFWVHWLAAVSAGVMLFGLALVVAPGGVRQAFSWLMYSSSDTIDSFGAEAVRYISLVHAVIGGVMVGWGAALLYVVTRWMARGEGAAWNLLTLSVAAWYLPDTAYSLGSGFWQNAVFNTVFLVLFAVPLWALRRGTPVARSAG